MLSPAQVASWDADGCTRLTRLRVGHAATPPSLLTGLCLHCCCSSVLIVRALLSAEESALFSRVARADTEMIAKANPIKQISHLGRVGSPNPNPRPPVDDVGVAPDEDIYAAVASSRRVVAPMEQLLRRPVAHYHHKFMVKQRAPGYVEEGVDRPESAWQWQ